MGLTKLMHMKESSKSRPATHLKNGINYIMRDTKTDNGLWIGGNAGTTAAEVFNTFIDTKKDYEKLDGRQGYHFVITFKEYADPESAYKVMADFCKEYLGDNYDYVFTVHTDTDRVHAHVIFNSVARTTGLKYHYKKGDWKKYIQTLTDRVCQKYGYDPFEYEGGKHNDYGTWLRNRTGKATWRTIVKNDIDHVIRKTNEFQELVYKLENMGYKVRIGNSRKYGEYLALTPLEGKKAVRTYQLGTGYKIDDIKERIGNKQLEETCGEESGTRTPVFKSIRTSGILPRAKFYTTSYQYYYVRNYCKNSVLYNYQNVRNFHAIKETALNAKMCKYLLRNNIRTEDDLKAHFQGKKESLLELSSQRKLVNELKMTGEEERLLKRYWMLESNLEAAVIAGNDAELEVCQEAIADFEEDYPDIAELQNHAKERALKLRSVNDQYRELKREEKLIKQIFANRINRKEEKQWKDIHTQPKKPRI